MKSLPERIMGYADAKPEATPIQAGDLLHLGDRAAVSRALVANGGDAANWLGLTTQNMVRSVYFTSGPDRLLFLELTDHDPAPPPREAQPQRTLMPNPSTHPHNRDRHQ